MKINYLKKDMLIYELNIRGIPADDSKTVDSLRASLRPLFLLEKKNKSLNYPPYNVNFEEEKIYVRDLLKKTQSSLKSISGENARNKFERFQTYLVHLLNRVDRITIDQLSTEDVDVRASLLAEILTTLSELEQVSKRDPNLSVLLEAAHSSDSDSDDQSVRNSTRLPVFTPNRQPAYNQKHKE